jgi:ribosomal protein S13
MARIAGVDLPRGKRMEVALTYIFGLGRSSARKILAEANIDLNKKSELLAETEVAKIREILDRTYRVEGDLIWVVIEEFAIERVSRFEDRELTQMRERVRAQRLQLQAKNP